MSNLEEDLSALHNPSNIHGALLASSPYVLRKAFASDPTIQRIIAQGEQVLPLVARELGAARDLDEITLSAYAYIVENVKNAEVPRIFGPLFKKSLEKPGPFFVHFAAHALRAGFDMPIHPLAVVYSRSELMETETRLH